MVMSVADNFLIWLIYIFLFFLVMTMYANEFQTGKQKLTEIKSKLQHVRNSFPPLKGTNPGTTTHITGTANFNSTCI